MTILTPQQQSDLVSSIDYLEARWQDERAYEDFAEYRTAWKNDVRRYVPAATRPSLKMLPFAGSFQLDGYTVTVKVVREGVALEVKQAATAPRSPQEART
jgi:hypothetical protein